MPTSRKTYPSSAIHLSSDLSSAPPEAPGSSWGGQQSGVTWLHKGFPSPPVMSPLGRPSPSPLCSAARGIGLGVEQGIRMPLALHRIHGTKIAFPHKRSQLPSSPSRIPHCSSTELARMNQTSLPELRRQTVLNNLAGICRPPRHSCPCAGGVT